MTWSRGQSSWSVTRIRLPKISSSSAAWAFWSIRQARRSVAGVSPVSSVAMTRATQRGAQMVSISACTFAGGRRVRPRASRCGQLGQRGGGLAQGLGEPGLLGGVQARGVGQDHPAALAQHHRGGLERGQVLLGVGGHHLAVGGGAGEQVGMVARGDRPDEVQAQLGRAG